MKSFFTEIDFPSPAKVSKYGKMTPYEFYGTVIPISKIIRFKLGYFSSNAISTIAPGFARFIFHNGKAEFAINQFLRPKDYELLKSQKELTDLQFKQIESKTNNLDQLHEILKEANNHFYNCLRYLMEKGDLNIIPVTCADGELSHYKEAIFYDSFEKEKANKKHINGSCNFTQSGIIENGESFDVRRSWTNEENKEYISVEEKKFDELFKGEATDEYIYLSKDQLEKAIYTKGANKDIDELLDDEINLRAKIIKKEKLSKAFEKFELDLKKEIQIIKTTPRFPYDNPYPYQKEAYNAWVKNDYKGLLAMATGTGKTLTSLYCLIEEFKINNVQKNIFVVPTEELVRQWAEELRDCNFSKIFLWYGSVSSLKKSINDIKILKKGKIINIIVTYISFKSELFQKIFKDSLKEFTVVFDEVHNLGAHGVRQALQGIEFKKTIGLSATPLRLWDEDGENIFIEEMFKSYHPDYTFNFPMEKAIGKFLVNYNYYPFFMYLNNDEWNRYLKYTSQISFGDSENSINTTAALKRQLLLDQAEAKEEILIDIIGELIEEEKSKRTLVYCPKGRYDNKNEDRIIKELQLSVSDKFQNLNIQLFVGATKDRKELLNDFENDEVDMLFSIKVLDEGVNVPMAENAIFLASGKNYREFVQRRGRVLRKYKTNFYEKTHANIYDIVVLPTVEQYNSNRNTAKKLIVAEFKRLFEFFNMSYKDNDVFWKIERELEKYNLTQYHIEKIIKDEKRQNFTADS